MSRARGGAAGLRQEQRPAAAPAGEAEVEQPRSYLHAGQLAAATAPTLLTTILGSCVAVCVWDGGAGVGGMNHFLLPHWVGNGLASPRFGNIAVGSLIEQLVALGGRWAHLRAKVFGGACVLVGAAASGNHLGSRNVETALKILAREEIPVVARDVGGRRARKLLFQTDDGAAWVKRL